MHAPAFTSLGKYYEEHISPSDPVRASKCFQKAFELDSREVYAARRLAFGFAEEREWDLVEVVARRTIEGEGGLDAGLDVASKTSATLFTPMNAWAWKAVGAVELVCSETCLYRNLTFHRLGDIMFPQYKLSKLLFVQNLMTSLVGLDLARRTRRRADMQLRSRR